MKKFLVLLLTVIICLGLVACVENDIPDIGDDAIDNNIIYGPSESIYANHTRLKDVYGTWVYQENITEFVYSLFKSLTINEDGTCIIDGENGNWRIDDKMSSDYTLYIDLYINSEINYSAFFSSYENNEFTLRPVYRKNNSGYTQPVSQAIFTKQGA